MERAVASLERSMEKNERWLLCALLGCNDDWKLFRDKLNHEVWSGRDYLYSFMTEKDIQAKLTAELSKYNRCHVHVEIPVYGKTNKRGRRRPEPYNFRPDVFLLTTRRKEKRKNIKERHLELTAVEIKYFGRGNSTQMKKMIKKMIKRDMEKLRECVTCRVQPKADNGFFLCIDESGLASDCLAHFTERNCMKNIGYFVLTPNYVTEGLDYPMNLERYEQGLERSSVHVMDKVLGRLKRVFSPSFTGETVRCDCDGDWNGSAGTWFYICVGNKRIGWAYLDWQFRVGRMIRAALVIWLRDAGDHIGNPRSIKWDWHSQAYRYVENGNKTRVYLVKSRSFGYNLNKMNMLASEISRKVKKVASKAQSRMQSQRK